MSHVSRGSGSIGRARMMGAVALIVAFGLGCASTWWVLRERDTGLRVMITTNDAMPTELERLKLTSAQRTRVQEALRRGSDRVLRVVDAFDPRMRLAMDSTDQDIRVLLTDAQRAQLDSARALAGPARRRERMMKP
jgi:hypothetical protein